MFHKRRTILKELSRLCQSKDAVSADEIAAVCGITLDSAFYNLRTLQEDGLISSRMADGGREWFTLERIMARIHKSVRHSNSLKLDAECFAARRTLAIEKQRLRTKYQGITRT